MMTIDVITAARRRTRRALLWLVAVGVVVALVAVGALARRHPETGIAPLSASPTDSSATDAPATDATGTDATGSGVTAAGAGPWVVGGNTVDVAGVALPVHPQLGPARRAGGLASGFEHSPAGAVVAGLWLLVDTTPNVGPAVFGPTIATQVTGDYAVAMGGVVAAQYAAGGGAGDLPAVVVGVRMQTFTDTEADLVVATAAVDATGATIFAVSPIGLRWLDGDWRLVAPTNGSWDGVVARADAGDLGGFRPVGGGAR